MVGCGVVGCGGAHKNNNNNNNKGRRRSTLAWVLVGGSVDVSKPNPLPSSLLTLVRTMLFGAAV